MEMCEDIYANSEVITRRDQNKNSDYKTAGCYRWTTVGLLLLCVLLLAIIVVLTVKNNQLQTSYKNLTIEKEQIQTSYNNLTIENDQLQTSYKNLTIENDQLQTSYKNLTIENDQLQTSYKNLTIENNQLQTSYEDLTIKNDQLQTSYMKLTIENDQLKTSYKNLTIENDQLQTRYTDVTTAKNQLQTSYTKLKIENDKCLDPKWKHQFGSSLYYFSTERKNWSESRNACRDMNAYLVIINSLGELNFIMNHLLCEHVWVGLNQAPYEGKWTWEDRTELSKYSEFWCSQQPDNYNNNENCGEVRNSPVMKKLNDRDCSYEQMWICEKSAS